MQCLPPAYLVCGVCENKHFFLTERDFKTSLPYSVVIWGVIVLNTCTEFRAGIKESEGIICGKIVYNHITS